MRWILDTVGGVYELARLGLITGFRFRGPWWEWRGQTAFGRETPGRRMEVFRAVMEYGRWVHRMRRYR